MKARVIVAFVCLVSSVFAQRKVDLRSTHYRVLCVVPLTGKGTAADPYRPEYVPAAARGQEVSATGIIGFAAVLSDDGKHALVQLVARDRSAFEAVLADRRADVKAFEKGKVKKDDIEKEFRKYRKDFSLDSLEVLVP